MPARAVAEVDYFLYVVTCEGLLYKYDTRSERLVQSSDLGALPGKPPIVPKVDGAIEVCLLYDVKFDPASSTFYAAIPATGKQSDGPIAYSVARVAVPQLSVLQRVNAGEWDSMSPPRLVWQPGGTPRAVSEDDVQWPSEPLGTFGPAHEERGNSIIARSGTHALLKAPSAPFTEYAVADESKKTAVFLRDLGNSRPDYVHLAPGGDYVFVEDIVVPKTEPEKTGRVRLYSATTGAVVKTFADPRIRTSAFMGISPNGKVVYSKRGVPWFLNLGETFSASQVERVIGDEYPTPTAFFSAR